MNWLQWIWTIISVWAVGVVINNYICRATARHRYEEAQKLGKDISHSFESWLIIDGFTFVGAVSWILPIVVIITYIVSLGKDTVTTITNGIRDSRKEKMILRESHESISNLSTKVTPQPRRHTRRQESKLAFTPVRRKRTTSK